MSRWQTFLREAIGDEGQIVQLQKFFGYGLLPENKHGKALALTGQGMGKSTVCTVLQSAVGEELCTYHDAKEMENIFVRHRIIESHVNFSTQDSWESLNNSIVKSIIAGDPLTASRKHEDITQFIPRTKLVFVTNHPLPQPLESSLSRRLLIVSFNHIPAERNYTLIDDLLAEIEEIRGWMIDGAALLDREGF